MSFPFDFLATFGLWWFAQRNQIGSTGSWVDGFGDDKYGYGVESGDVSLNLCAELHKPCKAAVCSSSDRTIEGSANFSGEVVKMSFL